MASMALEGMERVIQVLICFCAICSKKIATVKIQSLVIGLVHVAWILIACETALVE